MAESSRQDTNWSEIVRLQTRAHHKLLPGLSVPITDGLAPYGARVASKICSIVSQYPLLVTDNYYTAIDQLAAWLTSHSYTPHRANSQVRADAIHPLHGKISNGPIYAALVDQQNDTRECDVLRAICLAFALQTRHPRGTRGLVNELMKLLRNPKGIPKAKQISVERLNTTSLSETRTIDALAADLQALLNGDLERVRRLAEHCFTFTSSTRDVASDRTGKPRHNNPRLQIIRAGRTGHGDPDGDPLDDQSLIDEWIAPPLNDDIEEPDANDIGSMDDVVCVGKQITPAIAEFLFAERTQHHLQGVWLADTERVLSRRDSTILWSKLCDAMESDSTAATRFPTLACDAVIALMLVTGRSRRSCASALSFHLRLHHTADENFSLTTKYWQSALPITYPGLGDADPDWFHTTSTKVQLPS